ncbi:hypothetical protein EMIT0111MI5_30251 [Burkholderia sp. IT-111MI5]
MTSRKPCASPAGHRPGFRELLFANQFLDARLSQKSPRAAINCRASNSTMSKTGDFVHS